MPYKDPAKKVAYNREWHRRKRAGRPTALHRSRRRTAWIELGEALRSYARLVGKGDE